MTKEAFKVYICEKIDEMEEADIGAFLENFSEDKTQEKTAEELIVIRGEFKKLTKLVQSFQNDLTNANGRLEEEQLKPFLNFYSFLKNSKDALHSMPPNTIFGSAKFNKAFGAFENGFDSVEHLYQDILKSIELELISKKGELFNADFHEAIETTNDNELENGVIVEVFEEGFSYKGRVLNYAKVKVNRWI